MNWQSPQQRPDGSIVVPDTWLYLHYYDALNVLFRVENGLRLFAYAILKNEFFGKWCELSLDSDDAEKTTIGAIAKRRMAQANTFGYLGYSTTCPVLNLTSGELIRLITSDAYWKLFARYFPGSREIMRNKLDEIGTIRNALAHFRPIKADDVALIKQNARHVLMKIEGELGQLFGCDSVIPTNTTESWCKSLRTIGAEGCSVVLRQSANQHWVRISLQFSCECLRSSAVGMNVMSYSVLNPISPAILKKSADVLDAVTFTTESVAYPHMPADLKPSFSKSISFVFGRESLSARAEPIKAGLDAILLQYAEESELVKQDNLAQGELVELVGVSARRGEGQKGVDEPWKIERQNLYCRLGDDAPPEYLGNFVIFQSEHLVSDVDQYPWMPTDVASFPF
jgi:hypothetical protein